MAQAVYTFHGLVRKLHPNCTAHEARKGDSNAPVQLGIAKHIEELDPMTI